MADDTSPAYAICAVADIANRRSKGFHLLRLEPDGREVPWHIFILRWDRKLYGYVNACPHQGTHLDWEHDQFLDPGNDRLVCGKHGSLFDVATGACTEGPCRGASLQKLQLSVIDNEICVRGVVLAEGE
jgi:nitrite reductase/ring-hydroxylating ferredoxin subunit